jgi:hypothetical protein
VRVKWRAPELSQLTMRSRWRYTMSRISVSLRSGLAIRFFRLNLPNSAIPLKAAGRATLTQLNRYEQRARARLRRSLRAASTGGNVDELNLKWKVRRTNPPIGFGAEVERSPQTIPAHLP